MATCLDQITRALRMLGVVAEGETPRAEQSADALVVLNAMLAAWNNNGINLNLPSLVLTDAIPLPADHDNAIAYNLALGLAAEFGVDPKMAPAQLADSTFRALQAKYASIPEMVLEPEYWRRTEAWYRW